MSRQPVSREALRIADWLMVAFALGMTIGLVVGFMVPK